MRLSSNRIDTGRDMSSVYRDSSAVATQEGRKQFTDTGSNPVTTNDFVFYSQPVYDENLLGCGYAVQVRCPP